MFAQQAPVVRTRSKSRYSDIQDARAIEAAAQAWCTTDCPIPLMSNGKLLGMIGGNSRTAVATFVPAWKLSTDFLYDDYDAAVQKCSMGLKTFTWHGFKLKGAGIASNWYDCWPTYGTNGPGAYGGTARTAKQFTKTTTGSMFHGPDVSTSLKFLKRFSSFLASSGNQIAVTFLYDRVLAYESCSMTNGNQTMDNTLTAQRFAANGERGLQIWPTADAVHNATAADLTQVRYTNQAGTALQSVPTTPTLAKIVSIAAPTTAQPARMIVQGPATTQNPTSPFLALAAGDLGAQLINDYSFSAAPTGTNCFALVWPYVLNADHILNGQTSDTELLSGVEALAAHRIYDDACISVGVYSRTATNSMLDIWAEVGWQ